MSRTTRAFLLATFVALVVAPTAVSAQTGSISGFVLEAPKPTSIYQAPRPPIPGVGVSAFDSGGALASSTVTGSDGLYTLSGLTPGTYYVRTAVPGGSRFLDQLYDDKPCESCNVTLGTPITVSAGSTTSPINFYLKPVPTTVATMGASNITTTGATLNGTVNPNGTSAQAMFEFGTTTTYGSSVTVSPAPGAGTSPVAISAAISGLACNTRYHFRAAASNYQQRWEYGADQTFDTVQCPPTIGPIANVFTPPNTEVVVPLTVQSTAGADGVDLSAVASNPELISALIFTSGTNRSLAIGPAPGMRGVTTITITASDSTGTSTRSFGLRIGAAIRGDVNNDMKSDIFWRHSSGTVAIWMMNGTDVIGGGEIAIIDPAWHIDGIGDFNADNHADIFWRHTNQTGFIWLLGTSSSGIGVIQSGPLQNLALNPLASWIGDLDGDGRDDFILTNPEGISIYFMDGIQYSSAATLGSGPVWRVHSTGDYNSDGRTDILWRTDAGDVAMWTMNGSQQMSVDFLGNVDQEWQVVGSGDYNGDLKADLLWRHSSGAVVIWFMNSGHVIGGGEVATVDPAWQIAGTSDYNGDARADILWRHTSGAVTIWLMNGLQVIGGTQLGVVDPAWQIVPSR